MSVDVGLFTCPADDGAVVRALARDGERFARLPAGTAEVAVVEGDGDEALLAEALGERGQSPALMPPMPWAITTAGWGPLPSGR